MKNVRILHCGKSTINYNSCVDEKVAGFTHRFRDGGTGDLVYIVVNNGNKTYCGVRGILGELTDIKPWDDSERYLQSFKLNQLEFCEPFDINFLREVGGSSWSVKYLQGSKLIKDMDAIDRLNDNFMSNKTENFHPFYDIGPVDKPPVPEDELDILGTYQTILFRNETDPIRGLESLVTKYFYKLFEFFKEEKSILISDNRLFSTVGLKDPNNKDIIGIKGIPDALLITFDKDSTNTPLRIDLIEYECYGEGKSRKSQKFNYLNGTIIPQLIRFASTFSIVTDYKIRERTINDWIERIISYIDEDDILMNRVDEWMREINPQIKDREINSTLKSELKKAFESNIKIMLIIDELTTEQKNTIKNVINSFKLSNENIKGRENSVGFSSYVVRLEQNIIDQDKYVLSFQE